MVAQSKDESLPWQLEQFQVRPATKQDRWIVMPAWIVRAHGSLRTQPFLLLHESFPLKEEGNEVLDSSRVTVAFFEGEKKATLFQDSWTTSPTPETRAAWKQRGKWNGFTFFRRKSDDTNGSPTKQCHKTRQQAAEHAQDETHDSTVHGVAEHLSQVTISFGYGRGGCAARGRAALRAPSTRRPSNDQQEEHGFDLVDADQ